MEIDLLLRPVSPNNWLILPLLVIVVLWASLKNKKRDLFFLVKTIFNHHDFKQLVKEQQSQSYSVIKLMSSSIIASIFIAVWISEKVLVSQFILYFLLAATYFLVYISVTWLAGLLFENQTIVKENTEYFVHFFFSISIVFIPLIVYLILYENKISMVVLLVYSLFVLVLYLVRLGTLYLKGKQQGFLLIHLILYLCTLEILPMLLFYSFKMGS
tara:strand:+ start:212 stop:853 length:642 start_codon:yes stop_codon:yes gene_type:complete